MAGKDPAILFYTSDFLSGVVLMTMKERGQYITLLCLQRERGHMSMKDMEKAVGKLSDEVRSKFDVDEDGKYYNLRMEAEIDKRKAHSQKQRENIMKRWNKPNYASGTGGGTVCGNTMVLPLGNGSRTRSEKNNNKSFVEEGQTISAREGLGRVMSAYFDKINPTPSQRSIDELKAFADRVGDDVCLRAIEEAIDAGPEKMNWKYIRSILSRCQQHGIRSLADWERANARRKKPTAPSPELTMDASALKKDVDWMDRFLDQQRREEAER